MNKFEIIHKNIKHNKSDYFIYTFSMSILYMLLYGLYAITQSQRFISIAENIEAFRSLVIPVTICIFIISINFIKQLIVFLVDKRKKPFSIYTLNGMNSWRFAVFFCIETTYVGIISVILGSVLGIFFTQGLALLLKNTFEVENISFDIIDLYAIYKILIFFVIVQLANFIYVKIKFKKNNVFKIRQSTQAGDMPQEVSLKMFLFKLPALLLIMIGAIYCFEYFFNSNDAKAPLCFFGAFVVFVLVFYRMVFITYKFFILNFKYKGFEENYFKHSYKKLCKVELKFNWKKNSKIISFTCMLSVIASICLILSLTMGGIFKQNIYKEAPFDFIVSMDYKNVDYSSVISFVKEKTKINSFVDYNIYEYNSDENKDFPQQVIKLSYYNKLRKMLNLKEAFLNKNEYIIHSEDKKDYLRYNQLLKNKDFTISDVKIKGSKDILFYTEPFSQKEVNGYLALLVLEDSVISNNKIFRPIRTILTADIDENVNPDLRNQVYRYINKSDSVITDVAPDSKITLKVILKKWTRLNGLVGLSILSFVGIYVGILIIVVCLSSISIFVTNNIDKIKYDYLVLLKLGIRKKIITSQIRYKLRFFMWPSLICGLSSIVLLLCYLYFKLNNIIDDQFFLLGIFAFVTLFLIVFYKVYYKISFIIVSRTI